jgi:TonB family protein
VSLRATQTWRASVAAFALIAMLSLHVPLTWAQQEELPRKVKVRVAPVFPSLARQMNISGLVKVQVTIAPNGSVKAAKLVGGHPLLATAAMDAVKKWRFESAPEETTGIVEFKFDPSAGGAQ